MSRTTACLTLVVFIVSACGEDKDYGDPLEDPNATASANAAVTNAGLLTTDTTNDTALNAHLAPGYLAAEVRILDRFASGKRARKGQRRQRPVDGLPQVVEKIGSSGRTRTYNPPVNRLMLVGYLVGSSVL